MGFFCGFMVVESRVVVVVVVEGGGVFIMGHMWVHGGEGGGVAVVMVVAMGFRAEVSRVAVGWWRDHGFRFGYVLRGGGGGGSNGGSRWVR